MIENTYLCFTSKGRFGIGWGPTWWEDSDGLSRGCRRRWEAVFNKEGVSQDGRKLQSGVQRLRAYIFHNLLCFPPDRNSAHLWLVWDFAAAAAGWSRAVICDWPLSIKRTPGCLGIILCLISIWQSARVNRLWISANPLYSWASSVWAMTVKTIFHSVKK